VRNEKPTVVGNGNFVLHFRLEIDHRNNLSTEYGCSRAISVYHGTNVFALCAVRDKQPTLFCRTETAPVTRGARPVTSQALTVDFRRFRCCTRP
jgi:hypothetical protein